jgi:hypothetical protein
VQVLTVPKRTSITFSGVVRRLSPVSNTRRLLLMAGMAGFFEGERDECRNEREPAMHAQASDVARSTLSHRLFLLSTMTARMSDVPIAEPYMQGYLSCWTTSLSGVFGIAPHARSNQTSNSSSSCLSYQPESA